MATAITDYSIKDTHGCPICLDGFKSTRQLPCLHSFCEHCLQDYITKKAKCSKKTLGEILCPVCRAVTKPANKGKPVVEWAALFPNSPFPVVEKSKVERSCEVCLNESDSSKHVAKKFCVVCEECMCDNCAVSHKSMKMSKNHQILTMDELENNPEIRIRLKDGFGCPEHDNEEIKFYCRGHETACCGTCFFHHHKACPNVIELKESLPFLLKEIKARTIMEHMSKLEDHLKVFKETNEENVNTVESQVKNISAEIGDIRRKFNGLLDDIERIVKVEGNRIYKEWVIRKQEQNHQCLSLVSAIKNSQALLEMVGQFGFDIQKFLVASKTLKQLQCYSDQTREKFKRVANIRIRLEFDSNMKAVLSKDAGSLVKIICQEEAYDSQCTILMMPLQKRTVKLSRVIPIQCPSENNTSYSGIVLLPNGYTLLADYKNMKCCLYDSSFNFITTHLLLGSPCKMCLIGDNEVAITIPKMNTVQFLSIRSHSISDMENFTTKYQCCGVDVVNMEEIVVSGRFGGSYSNKCYWSLITRNGNVKIHHEFDCRLRTCNAYIALDMSRSRVYISVSGSGAVYCFGLTDGKQHFIYSSNNLSYPMDVAVDGEDNIYVVGHSSNNIHKLSLDGVTLQVITSGVPKDPAIISFNRSRDHLVVMNLSPMGTRLHYFVNK